MPKRISKPKRKRLRAAQRAKYCERKWQRGEKHHKAVLTNRDVDLMLELRAHGFTYDELVLKFECSKTTVHDICKGLTRVRFG